MYCLFIVEKIQIIGCDVQGVPICLITILMHHSKLWRQGKSTKKMKYYLNNSMRRFIVAMKTKFDYFSATLSAEIATRFSNIHF